MCRWIGAPLKQQLNTLKPVQLTELETEFQNLGDKKAVPTRYLKSQKPKEICVIDSREGGDEDGIFLQVLYLLYITFAV